MAKAVFDKGEALIRYREGEKVTDIAVDMGVSKTEVYNAIRELKRAEEWGAVKALASGAAESGAVTNADGVSGADNTQISPEGKKLSEGVSVGEAAAEKPAPKKRGRKKKAEENEYDPDKLKKDVQIVMQRLQADEKRILHDPQKSSEALHKIITKLSDESKPNIDEIKAKAMDGVSHEDKSDTDIEAFTDDPAEWAARRYAESRGKTYTVKFRNGTELKISGVREITDSGQAAAFRGASGKAVVVSAAELLYYYPDECKAMFNNFSVE